MPYSGATAPVNCDPKTERTQILPSTVEVNICEDHTFVMMTSSSRGRLSFLMTFPSMTSDSPFEYTYTAGRHQHT